MIPALAREHPPVHIHDFTYFLPNHVGPRESTDEHPTRERTRRYNEGRGPKCQRRKRKKNQRKIQNKSTNIPDPELGTERGDPSITTCQSSSSNNRFPSYRKASKKIQPREGGPRPDDSLGHPRPFPFPAIFSARLLDRHHSWLKLRPHIGWMNLWMD